MKLIVRRRSTIVVLRCPGERAGFNGAKAARPLTHLIPLYAAYLSPPLRAAPRKQFAAPAAGIGTESAGTKNGASHPRCRSISAIGVA